MKSSLLFCLLIGTSTAVSAQSMGGHGMMGGGAAGEPATGPVMGGGSDHMGAAPTEQRSDALATGVVRKVDTDAEKITLRHGPLVNLDMPAMTMVFHVGDPTMLGQVKAGDNVRFRAARVGGVLTITEIQPEN